MEPLGEEDEEEDEDELRGYDAAVRERELATQKARIVSQMAATGITGQASHLSPRKTVAASRTVPNNNGRERDIVAGKRDRISLFDVFAQNLVNALAIAVTDAGFRSPRKRIPAVRGRADLTSLRDRERSSSAAGLRHVLARLLQ